MYILLFVNKGSDNMVLVDSKKIRQLMFEKDLGVKQVALAANLQVTTISHVTRFDKRCTLKTANRLSKALQVEPTNIIKQIL